MSDVWESRQSDRRSKRQISSMQFVFVAILAVGLLLALNLSDRIAKGQRIQANRELVEREIAALKGTQTALQATLAWVQNPAFVEAWARSEGKMARPGEVLVVPVPVEAAPTPTPQPTVEAPSVAAVETWTVWWKLFFDEPPPQIE
ncbi:MAG: septum formation initiator family protein [Anaerolineae bacterium]|nr:septum formation initiator family protein [Anaerolineae bacterium]